MLNTNEYVFKRKLNNLMWNVVEKATEREKEQLKELLDGMAESLGVPGASLGPNGLCLADWGDAFVVALNEEMHPKKVLFRKVKAILMGAFDETGSISPQEVSSVMQALEVGLGL